MSGESAGVNAIENMKTTHIRITKEAKKRLKGMAQRESKTTAEKLEDLIGDCACEFCLEEYFREAE